MRKTKRINKTKQKKNNKLTKKYDLYNGDKWDNYRFGDVFYGHLLCWNQVCLHKSIKDKSLVHSLCKNLDFDIDNDTEQENKEWCQKNKDDWVNPKNMKEGYLDSLSKNFPGSIADHYIKKVGYPENYRVSDLSVLKSIFRKLSYQKPLSTSLVIHLRLGDVLSKKYINDYVYDFKYYQDLYKRIQLNKNIKQVDIVTGLHKKKFVKKSNDYLQKIIKLFEQKYPVKVVLTKNPDKDLYYMCHSKIFANSGGGFSRIITNYLKEKTKAKIYTDDTARGGNPNYPRITYSD